jgi:fatty acid desaturase
VRLELATLFVAVAIYGGFAALTWFYRDLPLWLVVPLGALLIAWHGSLQHETIHDHPTPWRWVNSWIGGIPLSLWIPYPLYRHTHLRHHGFGGRYLTDPLRDPESFYLPLGGLASRGPLRRFLAAFNCTLAGRMLVGPLLAIGSFWISEAKRLVAGDLPRLAIWMVHAVSVAILLAWVVGVCRIPFLIYVFCIVYPGASVSLIRSFTEHHAHHDPAMRTAVVEAHPFWGLLFLNNNLHVVHHDFPAVPWYALPALWRTRTEAERARVAGSGLLFRGGYLEVMRLFMLRPAISVEHPDVKAPPG